MAGRTRRILGDRTRRRQGALDRLSKTAATQNIANNPESFQDTARIEREIAILKKRLGLLVVSAETTDKEKT